jgi:hypothetical protein
MGIFYQNNPALGHAGEGVTGIDDLREGSLARLVRGEVELSQLGEEGIYDFAPRPLYEIDIIPVQEIEVPSLALGQFPL